MNENKYINKLKFWHITLKLNKMNDLLLKQYVNFFSSSVLPNNWFLQQFKPNARDIFRIKANWELFARVLVDRGVKKLGDNLVDMLEFLYEPYYNSCDIARKFILCNFDIYKTIIINFTKNAKDSVNMLLIQDIIRELCDLDKCFDLYEYEELMKLTEKAWDDINLINKYKNKIVYYVEYLITDFVNPC